MNVLEGKPQVGEGELSSHLVLIFVTGIYHHMPSRNEQLNLLHYHILFRHPGFSSILMMEAEFTSETSVQFHKSTRRHIPEDNDMFANWHSPATLTEVFPCFFLSCKVSARVYLAKTGTVRTLRN